MDNKLGHNIMRHRKGQGMTQEALACKLHISRPTLSNYETGRRSPDIDMLIKLADVFDVSIDSLVGRDR